MSRSKRLKHSAIRHGMIAGVALLFAIASASWMCAAMLYGRETCAIIALCFTALAAFVVRVEGADAIRLCDLYHDELVRELRDASLFPHKAERYTAP